MWRRTIVILAGAASLLGGCAATAPTAGTEQILPGAFDDTPEAITLDRPQQVGARFEVRARGSQERRLDATTGGRPQTLETRRLAVTFEAVAETLAVDDHRRPTAVESVVRTCVMQLDGAAWHIARPPATIIARRTARGTEFEIDGMIPSADEHDALMLVAALPPADAGDDAIMGSPSPRRPGEHWAIDRQRAAERATEQLGAPARLEDVFGATTFMGRREFEGLPCVAVHNRTSVEGTWPYPAGFPRGFELQHAFTTTVRQGMYPARADLPALAATSMTNYDALFEGAVTPGRLESKLHLRGRDLVRVEVTPLAAGTLVRAE